jgi:hypothetical protein
MQIIAPVASHANLTALHIMQNPNTVGPIPNVRASGFSGMKTTTCLFRFLPVNMPMPNATDAMFLSLTVKNTVNVLSVGHPARPGTFLKNRMPIYP